jgi:hypothetical protein
MMYLVIIAVSFWLLFNLFLFAHLGPRRSAELWNDTVHNFRASSRRPH